MADEVEGTRKRPADEDGRNTQRKRRRSDQAGASNDIVKQPGIAKAVRKAQRKLGSAKNQNKGVVRIKATTSNAKEADTEQKRVNGNGDASTSSEASKESSHKASTGGPSIPLRNYRKLDPPRPFPTVPASVSATGPSSQHHEGKNMILITRKTKLARYLSRCKDLIIKDGYKRLHLHALGAAIPHLLTLAVSLPAILPFPPEEIRTEVTTDTVEVNDEMFPTNDDEDFSLRTRNISTVIVKIIIGDGKDERAVPDPQSNSIGAIKRGKRTRGKKNNNGAPNTSNKGKEKAVAPSVQIAPEQIVVREIDQDSDADVDLEDE